MQYFVSRKGQTYGPYTLEDLQRYVASGNVLLTDLARPQSTPEGADSPAGEWLPVSQILGAAGVSPAQPSAPPPSGSYGAPPAGYAAPFAPAGVPYGGGAVPYGALAGSPPPPNLAWGLVLLFDVLTCSIFQMVWNIILGAWFRRVYSASKVLWLYIAAAVLLVLQSIYGQTLGFMAGRHAHFGYTSSFHRGFGYYGFLAIVCWVLRLAARFIFRAELEQHYNTVEPIGLRVDPVMTFFFGGIYLQSVMNRINESKRLAAYAGGPR